MKAYYKFILAASALLLAGCQGKKTDIFPIYGTIDGPTQEERAPQKVHLAMTLDYKDRYENILEDKENGVSVWSLVWCNPDITSEGYGIHIVKDGKTTHFPNIHHGKNPVAEYDAASDRLWLFCGVMEGTGVHVEKPYLFRFDEGQSARTVAEIDPYTVQEVLRNRLSVSIKGNDITFLENEVPLCTVTNTITDMGGMDEEQPIWIGEQLYYYFQDGDLYLRITPGVKFTTGLVLLYDDMPDLTARITISDNGSFQIGDITVGS